MAGVVSTREQCIQTVKALCPVSNIANMEKNFIDGREDIACYCHTGDDITPGKL
jgi:nitrite reductase/ring-hydroxylating ferredoxin subunit